MMQMEIGVDWVDGVILVTGAACDDDVVCCDDVVLDIVVVDVFIVWSFLKLLTDIAGNFMMIISGNSLFGFINIVKV